MVPGVSGKLVESNLLGSGVGVEARVVAEGVVVEGLPPEAPHEIVSVLSLSFAGKPVRSSE